MYALMLVVNVESLFYLYWGNVCSAGSGGFLVMGGTRWLSAMYMITLIRG